jgi:methylenetetrahydrofolate reductase (NADPH)
VISNLGADPTRRLGDLLAAARLEIIPMRGIEDTVAGSLAPGSTITITCSPRKGPGPTLDLAERLAARGYEVVPHLSARTLHSRSHLQELLGRMEAASIRRAFVIGGDGHDPLGPFASAGELLVAMGEIGYGPTDIGVGGYAEGHPLIEDEVLMAALLEKQPFATHLATQICFAPDVVGEWIRRIRDRGVVLPVVLGMAGAIQRRRLIEISLRVGVGPSVRYVSKYAGLVARMMRRGSYRSDGFVAASAPMVADPAMGIAGFHVFTFNQVATTERWRQELADAYRGGGVEVEDAAEDAAS